MKRRDTGLAAGAVSLLMLFKGELEYISPLFQRQYVWGKKEISDLWSGVDEILDGSESERFLGALVLEVKSAGASFRPDSSWIVDGQQRLTTLYLSLLTMAKVAQRHGASSLAHELFNQYLFNQSKEAKNRPKIQPTLIDFQQFNDLFSGIESPLPNLLPNFGESTGRLADAAKITERAINERCFSNGVFSEELATKVITTLLEKLAFVQIILGEEHDAHQVFDSLNSSGVKLENKDLIRNLVFQKLSDKPDVAQSTYQSKWIPLEQELGEKFDGYFFPFALVHKPAVTKSSLLSTLRDKWIDLEAFEIIDDLQIHVPTYNALIKDDLKSPALVVASGSINEKLYLLNQMKCPTSVYSYVFRLVQAFKAGVLSEDMVAGNLVLIEAFLVRRAFAGFEPTGLHAVFKDLWAATAGDPQLVVATIEKSPTVQFPSDKQFESDIKTKPFYKRKLAPYVVRQYEVGLRGGDPLPLGASLTLDHVAPQELNDVWKTVFKTEEHAELVDTWANLVPLSGVANSEKGRKSWSETRVFFQTETMYKTTKRLATSCDAWDAAQIRQRAAELAAWAVNRWPKEAMKL